MIEAVEVMRPTETTASAALSNLGKLVHGHLSPVQHHQLTQLLEQYQDNFSCDDEDLGQIFVLEHCIRDTRATGKASLPPTEPDCAAGGS